MEQKDPNQTLSEPPHFTRGAVEASAPSTSARQHRARDSAAIKDIAVIRIMAIEDSEVVMVDAP